MSTKAKVYLLNTSLNHKSRMRRESHVRFCERWGGEVPPAYSTCVYRFRLSLGTEHVIMCRLHLWRSIKDYQVEVVISFSVLSELISKFC